MDGLDVHNSILDEYKFDDLTRITGHEFCTKDYKYDVTVVAIHDDSDSIDMSYYGEAPQGWTGVCWIVLRVIDSKGAAAYYKKLGTVDSYFGRSWDGKFVEVKPVAKEVIVYE